MNNFRVLQNGVPRSGNVWLAYLTRSLLQAAGVPLRQFISQQPVSRVLTQMELGIRGIAESDFLEIQPLRSFYTVLDVFRWPITDWETYLSETNQVATHSPWNAASKEVYDKFSHVIYIIRDPRDVALSMSRFAFTPFNLKHRPHTFAGPGQYLGYHFNQLLQTWVEHVHGHLGNFRHCNAYPLFYESMVSAPEAELGNLAEFLALNVSGADLAKVIEANSLRRIAEQQPHHTHKGIWGAWREELNKAQRDQAARIAGPLMQALGYPVDESAAADWTPDNLRRPA